MVSGLLASQSNPGEDMTENEETKSVDQVEAEAPAAPEASPSPVPQDPKTDPTIVGQLTPDEWNQVALLNQRHDQMIREVGRMEVQKMRLLGAIEGTDRQLQQKMQEIQGRLRIPGELAWNVWGDGQGNGYARLSPAPQPSE